MITFDAANREVCVVNRQMTTTPLQALLLMNDPQYAEKLPARLQRSRCYKDRIAARIAWMICFDLSLVECRQVQSKRCSVELYEEQLDYYKSDRSFADEFLNIGDHQNDRNISTPLNWRR